MSEQRESLIALYQAERSDLTALFLSSIAVLGFGATIAAASFAYLSTSDKPSSLVALVGPAVLFAVVLYNAVISGLARVREQSARRIEDLLYDFDALEKLQPIRTQVLVRAGARVLDLPPKFGRGVKRDLTTLLSTLSNFIANAAIILVAITFGLYGRSIATQANARSSLVRVFDVIDVVLIVLALSLYLVGHVAGGLNLYEVKSKD